MKEKIDKAIKKILGEEPIHLETPDKEEFGDYSFFSKDAALVVEKLKKDKALLELVDKVEVLGGSFINFWLKKEVLLDNLIQIDSKKDDYGKVEIGKGKTVVIDYSSPNIAKRFSIGHLRSTIIGQALYNLYKKLGYEVIGDNHLGDWGTQFGRLLYMIDFYKLTDFDIDKLEELYVEFHKKAEDPENTQEMEESARAWFKKLEDGDLEARALWQKCCDVSMDEFNKIYDLLNIKFDFQHGESFYLDEMRKLIADSDINKQLSIGEDGSSRVIDLSAEKIKIPLMFLKSDGATTYATRDLACIKFRVGEWKNLSKIIYEVGVEQTLHFQQVFAAARKLGLVGSGVDLYHTRHGLYLSGDGKKFRTREGGGVKLEGVLQEAIKRAEKLGSEDRKSAEMVGIGAVKYFDLMHSVASDIIFDWDKVMNLEGDSGPYLQYTAARTNSVLSKQKAVIDGKISMIKLNKEELSVARELMHYGEVVIEAALTYSPNLLCGYLHSLAQKYNTFYNAHRILESDNEKFRILLTSACGQVIKNGLALLGIEAPERM